MASKDSIVTWVVKEWHRRPDGSVNVVDSVPARNTFRGKDKAAQLEAYVLALVDSMKVGGVNEHVSKNLGYIPVPYKAMLINQVTGRTYEWNAPAFMVI